MATSMVMYEGANYLLNAGLNGGSVVVDWYIGIITNSGYSPARSHTLSGNLASMGEVSTFGTDRPKITGTVTDGIFDATATPVEVTATGTVTAYGLFICSSPVVGNNVGTLLGVNMFTTPKTLASTEKLELPVTISLA